MCPAAREKASDANTSPVAALTPSSAALRQVELTQIKENAENFRVGDTIKVYAKIVEGAKERIQVFEGIVISKRKGAHLGASFTVRKVSYNVGVERTFLLHSPRIDRIEVVNKGVVRRARLYYLRPLRGKAARIRAQFQAEGELGAEAQDIPNTELESAGAEEATSTALENPEAAAKEKPKAKKATKKA